MYMQVYMYYAHVHMHNIIEKEEQYVEVEGEKEGRSLMYVHGQFLNNPT